MTEGRVVLITAPDAKTAEALARELVLEKLAACVNVVSGVTSHYRWEGKLQADAELLLIVKTRAAAVGRLVDAVKRRHPAQVPEIIALPILDGDAGYLAWLSQSVP